MKFILPSLLTALVSSVGATVLIAVTPPTIKLGTDYGVEWLTDNTEKLDLMVVKKDATGFKTVKTLFKGVAGTPCKGNYTWAVGESYDLDANYGLYISSPSYADLSDYFKFTKKK